MWRRVHAKHELLSSADRAGRRDPDSSDYIKPTLLYIPFLTWDKDGKGGELMSAYETLSIMMMVLAIIVPLLIALINSTKK